MASLKAKEKNAKVVFSLESPFPELSTPGWPHIPAQSQQAVEELLCSLLQSLLDDHPGDDKKKHADGGGGGAPSPYILLGPNAVTSALESRVVVDNPSLKAQQQQQLSTGSPTANITAVFVTRLDSQPALLHAHLPVLCSLAGVPLIQLPKGAEGKLCRLLRTARVGFVGVLEGAPGAEVLSHTIQEESLGVVVRPSWLDGSSATHFLETKVKQ